MGVLIFVMKGSCSYSLLKCHGGCERFYQLSKTYLYLF